VKEGYFDPTNMVGRAEDVFHFLDGIAAYSTEMKDEAEARRMLRNMMHVLEDDNIANLKNRITELNNYFQTQFPGKKDLVHIQMLKGMMREWEVELLWPHFGLPISSIYHLRLGFYKGDIFSEEPEIRRDVMPILNLIETLNPNIVSVALDPEGSGPDTHYKVLQAVSEALKIYEKNNSEANICVWGYRNIWYRFHPSEANLFVPVSLNTMTIMHTTFMNCFGSQRAASFPSYEHDGPFSELAQKIQVEQYQTIKICLGKDFFIENSHPRLRAARGMLFIKEMNLKEFYHRSMELKKSTENL
jgi:glucosamine-6-phosphate deaminase